jgi:flagellar motor switch protein FliN
MNTGIIPQRVTVVLGETSISYDDLQKIGEGSIVQLNSKASGEVELRVNDVPVALGEILAVDDNFGIRVTRNLTEDEQKARMAQGKRVYLTEVIKQNG